ncbi:hypothetical protein INR49_017954 [Caranx melampygus]|nr:hypothetical protein INR49_017954 [Caranx melampygus]
MASRGQRGCGFFGGGRGWRMWVGAQWRKVKNKETNGQTETKQAVGKHMAEPAAGHVLTEGSFSHTLKSTGNMGEPQVHQLKHFKSPESVDETCRDLCSCVPADWPPDYCLSRLAAEKRTKFEFQQYFAPGVRATVQTGAAPQSFSLECT